MITDAQVVLAIFVLSFALILSEVVHRTIAAWFGSVLMLLYGHATGVFHPVSYTHLTLPTILRV